MGDEQPDKKRAWWHWASAAAGTAAFIVLLVWGPWWIEGHHLREDGKLVTSAGIIITGFRTMLVAIAAGVIGGLGLWYTHKSHRQTEQLFEHTRAKDREQAELTREGQVTERYVEAIKLLSSDNLTQRLGGIYSLERIMHDSQKDHATVLAVLCSFVRDRAPAPMEDELLQTGEPNPDVEPTADVQAVLDVLQGRPDRQELNRIDLRRTDLRGANLRGDGLRGANLTGSHLQGANLSGADLVGSDLRQANLQWANLVGTQLFEANLTGVQLQHAQLRLAFLKGANLDEAQFQDEDPSGTQGLRWEQLRAATVLGSTRLPTKLLEHPQIQARIAECEAARSRRPIIWLRQRGSTRA
ncbi:pentapeptide repeat-containing protein [Streptomyces sp. NPDC041068]|uniref:pentapeptide repeat-containing protein n=1 Tax=Streptomyces sp. NPDC041068 TaxID=3155130 RepID=UPI0034092F4C